MSLKTRLSVLLISTPVLAFVLVGGLLGNTSAATSGDEKFQHLRVFYDVVDLVTNNYVTEVEPAKVMEGAIRGLAEGLDPDSAYLTPQMVRSVESGEEPPAGEVGVDLTRQYYLRVVASRDGSPAARAGLQTGDYVRAIDGKPTRDMSVFEGTRLLRGQPGSKVKLTVIRGNAAEPHDIELVREKFAGPLVASRLLEGSTIGYVRVTSFRGGSINELKRQAADLTSKGATALIVDVRRTTDGALENGIEAARLFVKTGTLAVKAGREKDPKIPVEAKSGDGAVTVPVTVLVATGTSGAAELFASALDGNNRADLIGERTLGRAGIQKLVKLPEGRGLWLTYARYLRPNGDPLHGRGLQPDLEVDEPAATDFTAAAPTKDPVLDAAIARARG
jgi:carboxyl-terminal processing protease